VADEGPFIKMSVGAPRHPKIAAAGGDAAWLWYCGLDYCAEYETDGLIPVRLVPQLSDRRNPAKLARILVDRDLWHGPGHQCKRCVQPMPGYYVVHDYLEHQHSAEEVRAARDAKEAGGAYGNHRRWHVGRGKPDPGCQFCIADGSLNRSHMRSGTNGITDTSSDAEGSHNRSVSESPNGGVGGDLSLSRDQVEDLTPPTPPDAGSGANRITDRATGGRKRRRKAYDYAGDQDFLRFWDAYPAKKGKPEAYDEWLKALARGTDPEAIIAAAARYRDDPSRNPDKTKYPQGWLSAERYNDGETVAPGTSGRIEYPDSPWAG
jgi:hypothetical protein